MTNFIFKSHASDLQKISQQLLTILNNQRFARNDLAIMNTKMTKIFNALALQKQVDQFYESEPGAEAPSEETD